MTSLSFKNIALTVLTCAIIPAVSLISIGYLNDVSFVKNLTNAFFSGIFDFFAWMASPIVAIRDLVVVALPLIWSFIKSIAFVVPSLLVGFCIGRAQRLWGASFASAVGCGAIAALFIAIGLHFVKDALIFGIVIFLGSIATLLMSMEENHNKKENDNSQQAFSFYILLTPVALLFITGLLNAANQMSRDYTAVSYTANMSASDIADMDETLQDLYSRTVFELKDVKSRDLYAMANNRLVNLGEPHTLFLGVDEDPTYRCIATADGFTLKIKKDRHPLSIDVTLAERACAMHYDLYKLD